MTSHDAEFHDDIIDLPERPRRNRVSPGIRAMVRETTLSPADLIYPLFLINLALIIPFYWEQIKKYCLTNLSERS